MEMTGEEVVRELQKRYCTTSVIAECSWHLRYMQGGLTAPIKRYVLSFNFTKTGCSSMEGESFEECFKKLDFLNRTINTEMKRMSILLRQF